MAMNKSCRRSQFTFIFRASFAAIFGMSFSIPAAISQEGEFIEVTSAPFRFTNILASQITYNVGEIIPEIQSLGGTFWLDLVKSPSDVVVVPGVKEFVNGCSATSCPTSPVTKSSVNSFPNGHVDGQTIYRIRARAQITNSEGEPIFTDILSYPSMQLTYAVRHQWGDYNYNGTADAADYTVWRNSVGSSVVKPPDGSGNGIVDMADYTFWKRYYGKTVNTSSASAFLVPEPSSFALVFLFGVAFSLCRARGIRRLGG